MDNFVEGNNQFFIVGCQRTGSTLLELILDSHPNVRIVGDPVIYSTSYNRTNINYVGYKTLNLTHRYDFLKTRYPKAKSLFLFRNIKSIVCSLRKYYDQKWIYENIHNIVYFISNSPIRKFYFTELKKIKNNKLLTYAFYVFSNFHMLEEHENVGIDTLFIKYESLINDSKKEITKILDFLDLSWHKDILNHHLLHKGIFDNNVDSERSIDNKSLYLWKEKLKKEEIDEIDNYIIYLKEKIYN